VNRQIGVGDSKYVVIFEPLPQGHVTQRMRNVLYGRLHRENTGLAYIKPLQANKYKNLTV